MAEVLALLPLCAALIHPDTITRVVAVESGGYPFAINVNGARLQRQPRSLAEAIATARALRRQGYDFDAGLGQINVRNWSWLKLDEASVFDPCTNLKATQAVLLDAWRRAPAADPQAALRQTFSAYNTGSHRAGFVNGYVQKVVRAPALPPAFKQE
jgi:type IV secretion system protein VirB1